MVTGQRLPVDPDSGGKKAKGYCTPRQLKQPQVMCIPPDRVLPIIFIPGIMGTHLRMNRARQEELEKTDNVAWCPDDSGACLARWFAQGETTPDIRYRAHLHWWQRLAGQTPVVARKTAWQLLRAEERNLPPALAEAYLPGAELWPM